MGEDANSRQFRRQLKAYYKKLDEALASGDWRKLRAFPVASEFSDAGVEIAFHKMRVARDTLPEAMREESREWLRARGCSVSLFSTGRDQ